VPFYSDLRRSELFEPEASGVTACTGIAATVTTGFQSTSNIQNLLARHEYHPVAILELSAIA
jgi:hypothetical protein